MKKLIIRLLIFILPLIVCAICIESYNRVNNTFYAKKEYIEKHKDTIEILILGSSQTWRAINPEYLTISSAPLAHGESSFNIDYLLFKRFVNDFPKLKVIILEASYHTLEDYRDKSWNKNHLFYKYYDINNYGGRVPLTEYFLLSANPKAYINRIISSSISAELGEYNEFGYITTTNTTLDETGYDPENLKNRHNIENLKNFKKNIVLLNEMVDYSIEKGIDIVLFSPPKHKRYNQYNIKQKIKRRNRIFEKFTQNQAIHIWNYEKRYQNTDSIFYNEDHLNVNGAKIISKELDIKLHKIIDDKKD
jgi:hypothetical protein